MTLVSLGCTIAGIVGAALIMLAYFASQHGWLAPMDWRYSVANLAGAVLILISLIVDWNLPAAVVELFWAGISIYGLIRARRAA